jgi:hypothetical protein
MDGIASHGSVVCNPAWLDRPGSYAIVAAAQKHREISAAASLALIKRGIADFDTAVKKFGKAAACGKLNDDLNSLGG